MEFLVLEGLPPESEDEQDSEMEYNKTENIVQPSEPAIVIDTTKEEAVKEMLMKMNDHDRDAEKEQKITCKPIEKKSETKPSGEELVVPLPKELVPVQNVKVERPSPPPLPPPPPPPPQQQQQPPQAHANLKNNSVVPCEEMPKVLSSSPKVPKEENNAIKIEPEYSETKVRDPYEADDVPNLECDESLFDDSEESEVHPQMQSYQPAPVVMVPIPEVKEFPGRENPCLTKELENKEKKAKTRRKEPKEAKNVAVASSKESTVGLDERTLCYLKMNAKMYPNFLRGGSTGAASMIDGLQDAEIRRDVEKIKECRITESDKKRVVTTTTTPPQQPSLSAKRKAKKKIAECKDLEILTPDAKEINITNSASKKNSSISVSGKVPKCDKIDKCSFSRTKEFKDSKHTYLPATVPNSISEICIEPMCTNVLRSLASAASAEPPVSSEKPPVEQIPGGCRLEPVRSFTTDYLSSVAGGSGGAPAAPAAGVQSELVVSSKVAIPAYLPRPETCPDSEDVTLPLPAQPPQQQQQLQRQQQQQQRQQPQRQQPQQQQLQTSSQVDQEETPRDVDHEEEEEEEDEDEEEEEDEEEDDDFSGDDHEGPLRDPLLGGESPHECNASTISNDSCGSSSGNIPSSDSSNDVAPPPTAKRKREDLEFIPAKKKKRTNKTNKTGIERRRETKPSECEESYSAEDKGAETSSPEYEASPISHALSTHSSLTKSNSIANKPPRISKYNFNLDEADYLDGEKLITFLMDKIQQIRRIYMNLKTEVASIDRRRKRAKRKERENSQTASNVEVECV